MFKETNVFCTLFMETCSMLCEKPMWESLKRWKKENAIFLISLQRENKFLNKKKTLMLFWSHVYFVLQSQSIQTRNTNITVMKFENDETSWMFHLESKRSWDVKTKTRRRHVSRDDADRRGDVFVTLTSKLLSRQKHATHVLILSTGFFFSETRTWIHSELHVCNTTRF